MKFLDGYHPRRKRPEALAQFLVDDRARMVHLARLPKLPGRCRCGASVSFDFLEGAWLDPETRQPCTHTADGRG